jgi:signal transduction histidine kinase
LLLVTDGLLERHGESLDDGLARLLSIVEERAGDDLDQLCDVIVDRLVPPAAADDVAIVAVRPRPVAARVDRPAAHVHPGIARPRLPGDGHADQELWGQRPPPARTAKAAVLGRWQPRSAADLTAHRLQLAEAASAVGHPTAEAAERLELVFEELVSNALRHGEGTVEVTVSTTGAGWLLEVVDAARDTPPAPAVDRDAALGGLGLYLVARLTSAHGWAPTHSGRKAVWALVGFDGSAQSTEETKAGSRGD